MASRGMSNEGKIQNFRDLSMSNETEDIPGGNILRKLKNAKVHLWTRFVATKRFKCFPCFVCDFIKSSTPLHNSATDIPFSF